MDRKITLTLSEFYSVKSSLHKELERIKSFDGQWYETVRKDILATLKKMEELQK